MKITVFTYWNLMLRKVVSAWNRFRSLLEICDRLWSNTKTFFKFETRLWQFESFALSASQRVEHKT